METGASGHSARSTIFHCCQLCSPCPGSATVSHLLTSVHNKNRTNQCRRMAASGELLLQPPMAELRLAVVQLQVTDRCTVRLPSRRLCPVRKQHASSKIKHHFPEHENYVAGTAQVVRVRSDLANYCREHCRMQGGVFSAVTLPKS